jgi:ABC-type uncharacterized transport system involved in gliding motility auxiliary subunit
MAVTPSSIFALLGLAAAFSGWVLDVILPATRPFGWLILGIGALLILLAFLADLARVRRALMSRRGLVSVSSAVRISLFVGIIVLCNAISLAKYHRFDVTGLSQFTLTSQTKDVLEVLRQPVEVVSFFTPGVTDAIGNYAKSLLAEYRQRSDWLTVRSVDPDLSPDEARRYGVDQIGALLGVVVVAGPEGRLQILGPRIADEAEQAFTSAILEVTGNRQKKVLFLTGHKEHRIQGDYSSAARALGENLFAVGSLDLLAAGEVPADTAALVMAGPRQSLAEPEAEAVSRYLNGGGGLLLLFDPDPPSELRQLISRYGVVIEDGYIVDPAAHVAPNADNLLVTRERNDFRLAAIHFPGATAVLPPDDVPPGMELAALAWSSPESWLETNAAPSATAALDATADRKGPLAVGALLTLPPRGTEAARTRLAVIGDSDFAANPNFHNGSNSDVFLGVVNWLSEGTEVISIDRRVRIVRRLLLDPDQERFLHISSIALLPLLVLAAGGLVWWRQ